MFYRDEKTGKLIDESKMPHEQIISEEIKELLDLYESNKLNIDKLIEIYINRDKLTHREKIEIKDIIIKADCIERCVEMNQDLWYIFKNKSKRLLINEFYFTNTPYDRMIMLLTEVLHDKKAYNYKNSFRYVITELMDSFTSDDTDRIDLEPLINTEKVMDKIISDEWFKAHREYGKIRIYYGEKRLKFEKENLEEIFKNHNKTIKNKKSGNYDNLGIIFAGRLNTEEKKQYIRYILKNGDSEHLRMVLERKAFEKILNEDTKTREKIVEKAEAIEIMEKIAGII